MKKLKYLLFLFLVFLTPNVFAATYNVSSKIEAIPSFGGGTYTGYTPATAVVPSYYNVNTRYNGKLSIIEFYLSSNDWDWNYNKTYTITLNMATEDWRNNFMGPQVFSAQSNGSTTGSNLYVTNTFRFISYKQIKFNFKIGSTLGPYIKFRIYSTNTTNTAITGVSNFNLSSISISTVSSTPTPAPAVTPTPTPTPQPNNQDIINNNTQNTQDIINNNNSNTDNIINNNTQNTTDVINNNNSNTDKLIDEIKNGSLVCGYKYKETFKYEDMINQGWLTSTDIIGSSESFRYSDYIPIFGGNVYDVDGFSSGTSIYYNLNVYDKDKNFLFNFNYAESSNLDLSGYSGLLYFRINVNYSPSNNVMVVQNDGICVPTSYVQMKQSEDTINSINDNTNRQIDSQKVCTTKTINIDSVINYNTILNNNGTTLPISASWGVTDYYLLDNSSVLKVTKSFNSSTSYSCFYDENKNFISCFLGDSVRTINIPSNAKFVRFSLSVNNKSPNYSLYTCNNGNQALNDSINDVNNYLKDDTDATVSDSVLNDVFGQVHFTDPLSYLLTLPTQLINKIVSMSDTCSTIDLGTLYGVHLTLPCINLENYLGSDLWTIIDIILSVGLLSVIFRNFYDTISNLLTLGGEKEAKEKFSMPTPMDFLAMILGGDKR